MPRVDVVAAHHEPRVRAGLRALSDRQSDIDAVGEAASGEELESWVRELEPAVGVGDVALPGRREALDVTRQIVAAGAEARVVVLGRGEHDDAADPRAADGARAHSSCGRPARPSCRAPSAASPRGMPRARRR